MNRFDMTRRRFVGSSLAALLLGAARPTSRAAADEGDGRGDGSKYQLFWGDLHNHNAVGYAQGSLERSIEIALEHLDFFAFTGHASWHDMPKMPGDRHLKWVDGFQVHRDHWPSAGVRRRVQIAWSVPRTNTSRPRSCERAAAGLPVAIPPSDCHGDQSLPGMA